MSLPNVKTNALDVAEVDPQTLDWTVYGTVESWHEAFRQFCNKTYNTYGLPVNRKRLLRGWKEQMHEQSRLANEAKKAKE